MAESLNNSGQITQYFQLKKKSVFVSVPIEHTKSTAENFYYDCVLERENEEKCNDNYCANRKLDLINKLEEEKQKLANLEKALASCLLIIEDKEKKIAQLQRKSYPSNGKGTDAKSMRSPKTPIQATFGTLHKTPTSPLFKKYDKHLSQQQLAHLRSFERDMRGDSGFILSLMRSLYEDDLSELNGMEKIYSLMFLSFYLIIILSFQKVFRLLAHL